jgi:hypothetical protein
MQLFLSIVLWLMIGSATAYFANQRGRDPLIWFMLGMLFGFLGLLLLFILPPVSEEEIPNEEEYRFLEAKEEIPAPINHDYFIKEWFYYDSQQQRKGPVGFDELMRLWKNRDLNEDTFVWSEGMNGWEKIEEVRSLYTHLQLGKD